MSNLLTIKNLSIKFGKEDVLKGVTFDIPKGSIVGIVGANGAGKSTTMKCIVDIYKGFTGTIDFEGYDVAKTNPKIIGSKMGAMIESPALYPYMTGRQNFNVDFYPKEKIDRVINLLKMNNYIDQKVNGYSFGMKQKLGIALALVNEPDFVILDEPTNGLDFNATEQVRNVIKEESAKGTTFLVSSHDLLELEKIVNDVVMINNGKILFQRSLKNLENIGEKYYDIETSNNKKAVEILNKKGITAEIENSVVKVNSDASDLTKFIKLLFDNNISLLDINHETMDLESATVHIMKQLEANKIG